MKDKGISASRRTLLQGLAMAPGAALLASVGAAQAAGTVPQATAKYQNHPQTNGQHCGACNYFLPGKVATGPGQCKLVVGVISPNGWCQLFAPKHA